MSLSIQFIVEDGTKVANANSYITVTEFKQYWVNRGVDYETIISETEIKTLLIQATTYCDIRYRFVGEPVYEDQALQWPRDGVLDSKGRDILYNEIPDELKNAICEIAKYRYDNGDNSLDDNNEGIINKKIGPVSVTYGSSENQKIDIKPATRWLKNFLNPRTTVWRV